MGNKLCKKKSDLSDNPKSPTPFDRIINRLHLRPNSWKSDSHLNQKQVNRCKSGPKDSKENVEHTQPLSKSSDWTDVALEVPEKDEAIHLRNPKLSLIFDNDVSTPTPPPRKHKKGFREKIEAVAKNGLQAFQAKKPVEEPLCVKKTITHTCPLDDHDCAIHNRNHKHEQKKNELNKSKEEERLKNLEDEVKSSKENKRKKNLSVVSLPNYNELKLAVATFDDIDKKPESADDSLVSLPNDSKKLTTVSTGKLETCMTRCRSFGSLLPQQLLEKLRVRKAPTDIESDDSFGGLEDWDLRIIEHYNPKDTSLPRPSKLPPKNNRDVLADMENLIVKDEDVEKPKVPARRSESLLKKINREASETAACVRSQEPQLYERCETAMSITPPPSPERKEVDEPVFISADKLPTEENGKVEHSSLMKILEEFSIKDKQKELAQNKNEECKTEPPKKNAVLTNHSSPVILTKPEFQKKIDSIEDFLHNEKMNVNKDMQYTELGNLNIATT